MKKTASETGDGKLTVDKLKEMLDAVPAESELWIKTEDSQRDGPYWTFTATWE